MTTSNFLTGQPNSTIKTEINREELNQENVKINAIAKEVRLSKNSQKCEIALKRGYKYNEATGEVIGKRGNVIKARINGYTIISFTEKGTKYYLYATTFIEYLLKKENETITNDEIELAKAYVKPSAEYIVLVKAKRKALRDEKNKIVLSEPNYAKRKFERFKTNPVPSNSVNPLGEDLTYKEFQSGVSFPVTAY